MGKVKYLQLHLALNSPHYLLMKVMWFEMKYSSVCTIELQPHLWMKVSTSCHDVIIVLCYVKALIICVTSC